MPSAPALAEAPLQVGRARLSGPGAERGLFERTLAEVPLDGLELGPEEVLFVPRLVGAAALRPDSVRHFAAGVALQLGDLLRSAERDPVGGSSAGDRPCRFSSRSAFAAWLIGACLAGPSTGLADLVLAATGRRSPAAWWRAEVLAEGRVLVPVLVRLALAGQAASWLEVLAPEEVELADAALRREFALPGLGRGQLPGLVHRLASDVARGTGLGHPAEAQAAPRVVESAVEDTRRALEGSGNSLVSLPVRARAVLLAAMTLARTPAIPRVPLVQAVARLAASTGEAALWETGPLEAPGAAPAPLAGSAPVTEQSQPAPGRSANEPPHRAVPATQAAGRLLHIRPADPASPEALPVAAPEQPHAAPRATPPPWNPFADEAGSGDAISDPFAPRQFSTGFGGLLFLLGAFAAMGFYPDFTRPLDPALECPPLRLVDHLGGFWFGRRYRRDPLHRWIRATHGPARLPTAWRAEPDWLNPFASRRTWHDGSALWHGDGFILASPVPPLRAARIAAAHGLLRPESRLAPARMRAAPRSWLECLALFLAARLRRAAPGEGIHPRDLAVPGTITVNEDRLDFHAALMALPLGVRVAGLDRDPGWLPTEGRDVRYHFT